MIIVDTDVLIWILRGDRMVGETFKKVVAETKGYIFITPIQIAEIYKGLRTKEKLKVETFLETLNVIDIDKNIGRIAGEFLNKYESSHNVTIADAIIGASAKINLFKLWTLNKKHYPMFVDKEFIG
jgi:predicted nucleic acid-binding protein